MSDLPDSITTFIIDRANVRGRVVRLNTAAQTILSRYDYPPTVARLLGELLLVTSMLGSNLKQDGVFTIQIRGTGLIPLLVVDAAFGGQLRGFAEVGEGARERIVALGEAPALADLFGADAYLAITLDPGENMQRYQGVVALEGTSITDAIVHYFTHSQQVEVLFKLAVTNLANHWLAGGLMIERLPEAEPSADGIKEALSQEIAEEGWRYARAIAETLNADELTDPLLDAQSLLYRLYHEEGVWVHDAQPLSTGCRCSRERIHGILLSMPDTDRADMIVDGAASVHCQFCNTTEQFTPQELGLSVN